jgi:hypothetical protein
MLENLTPSVKSDVCRIEHRLTMARHGLSLRNASLRATTAV